MAVSYVSASSGNSGSATDTSFVTTLPTGWQADDIVVLTCHFGGASLTATDPAGWTDIPGPSWPIDQSTSSRMYGWYRVMQGGDTAPTISLSGSATGGWTATCYRGADTASPIGQVGTSTNSGTSITLAALTGVLADSALAAHVHARVPTGTSAPSGMTQDADYTEAADHGTSRNSGSAQNVRMSAAYRLIAGAGDYSGDSVSTDQTSSLAAVVVEVLSAAGDPPPAEEPVVDGPAAAIEPKVELLIDGVWEDITSDVRQDPGVTIVRGRPDERSRLSPGSARLAVNNTTGKYSPRKPDGVWYGKIGRNTPLRVSLLLLEDTFTRSSASGWGDADTGQSWTAVEGAADDYTVSSNRGNHVHDSAGALRQTYAAAIDRADVTAAATFRPGVVATGGVIQQSIMLRRQSTTTFYYALAIFNTDSTVDLMLAKRVSDVLTVLVTSTDSVPYTASTEIRLQATIEGNLLTARMWDVADPTTVVVESITDTSITDPGSVGFRSFVNGSNSNTKPLTLGHDDVEVLDVRFTGEVPAWAPLRDVTGRDAWVPIEAAGILRRLGQGSVTLRSALAREILSERWDTDVNAGSLLSYWPLEDASGSTSAASALPDQLPMTMASAVDFASVTGPGGSDNLPSFDSGQLVGEPVPGPLGTDKGWWVGFVFKGEGTSLVPLDLVAGGSLRVWKVTVTSSAVTLTVKERHGGTVMTAAATASCLDGEWHFIMIEAYQDTSTQVNAIIYVDDVDTGSDTDTTHTLGSIDQIFVPGDGSSGVTSMSVGHVSVWTSDGAASPLNLYGEGDHMDALAGYAGETAGARMVRLCAEENVPLVTVGDSSATAACGAQRVATLPDLLTDAADADQGLLYEARHSIGFAYKTRNELYNQTAALALDYDQSQVAPPFEPNEDDQLTRNDVTATRLGGSNARYQVTSGPLSTQPHPDGVGSYEESLTVNVELDSQLRDIAGWRAHLGTWDEERYPHITVNLHSGAFTASQFLTDDAADVDVGDVVSVDNVPDRPDLVRELVQGSVEYITPYVRRIEWNCSPAGPWDVAVLEDDDLGRLESGTSTVASDFVSGTDTSMSVTVTGTLWSTTDEPWDIYVSGVRLTVTAVSGASSPQTFTITQTPVNGVAKTIPAGSEISLWSPMRLAL